MQLFFGLVGLFNILFLWPLGVILHYTGAEPFEWPTDGNAIRGLLINVRETEADFTSMKALILLV